MIQQVGAWLSRLFCRNQRISHQLDRQSMVRRETASVSQPFERLKAQSQITRIEQRVTGDRTITVANVERGANVTINDTLPTSFFVPPGRFFYRWLNKDRIFNHLWNIEGRTDILEALKGFSASSEMQVALLIGRGGIGKTKILREFSSDVENAGISIYFVEEGINITQDAISSLPPEECIIVVDDAHRRTEEIATLCRLIDIRVQTGNPPVKLVLSLRPHGLQTVESELSRQGIRYLKLDEIKELGKTEREALAQQALGEQHSHLASSLASMAYDSPLVIVVGGQLIASQSIPINLISRQEDCRREILNRFEDLVIGDISREIDQASCRSLLELLSAVVPARVDNDKFFEAASGFLEVEKVTLKQQLGLLEESGILLRRGSSLRITPDVLADHILYKACITGSGSTTGYARKVFDSFRGICSSQIVYNLAELDWQLRAGGEQPGHQLVTDVLKELKEEFINSSTVDQYSLLDDVWKIAYYQPDHALSIVQYVMSCSDANRQTEGRAPLYDVKPKHLLAKLPKILSRISYHIDYVPICCDLLWQLGRGNPERPRNNPPEAITSLEELAEYDLYKPFEFNRAVFNAILKWLKEPDAHGYIYSPIDILDPLLERGIEHSEYSSGNITITHVPLAYRQIKELREEVLQVLESLLRTENSSVSLRALESLIKPLGKLRVPRFSQEDLKAADIAWEPEQLRILDIISSFVDQEKEAVLTLRVVSKLRSLSVNGSSPSIQQKADHILSSIEYTDQLKLTGVLIGNCDWDAEASQTKENWEEQLSISQKVKSEVVSAFADTYPNFEKGLEALEERLSTLLELGENTNYGFFEILSEYYPVYALDICEAILQRECGPIAAYIHPLLYRGRKVEPDRTAGVIKKAIASGDKLLCLSFASRYYGWDSFLCSDDLYVLASALLSHSDLIVKRTALENLHCLTHSTPNIAIKLALAVETHSDSKLLDYVFSVFESIGLEGISEETIQILLKKLESVDSLGEYHIQNFLDRAVRKLPSDVVKVLIKRIENKDIKNARAGNVLPSGYGQKNCLAELYQAPEYLQLLKKIRDRWFAYDSWLEEVSEEEYFSVAAQSKMEKERLYRSLYKQASLYRTKDGVVDVTTESMTLLKEWIELRDQMKTIAASKLISCFNSNFIFSHMDTVSDLLNRSKEISENCHNTVYNNLWIMPLTFTGVSSIGEDPPEKIALRDQAKAVTARLNAGTPAHRFFESIARQAESEIEHQRKLHEELFL